jgi:CW_7 repeat
MPEFHDNNYLLSKVGSAYPERSLAKVVEVIEAAKAAGHRVRFIWGMGSSTEHSTGNAVDFMIYDNAAGDFIRDYIWKNRERFGLIHVIWEQAITSTVREPGKIRPMPDRGNTTKNHFDHVHALFNSTAYRPPGVPVTQPPPKPQPVPQAPARKPVSQIAAEVIQGKWGNGDERINRLRAAGYDPAQVQAEVNRQLHTVPTGAKTVSQIAHEVINGHWGNGATRRQRLASAGYNPDVIQKEVNRLLR